MPLIVLEGIDASGKKTQAELLVKALKAKGRKAVLLDFPSYSKPTGKLIASYLKGEFGKLGSVPREFSSMLFALDRYERSHEISDLLKRGYIVVLDRYTQANLAYQTAGLSAEKRRKALKWIEDMESALPQADAVVFLDVPPSHSSKLIEGRKSKIAGVRKDIHEKDSAYTLDVYDNYLRLAKEKKWFVIPCTSDGVLKPKAEIARLVFDRLRKSKVL